MLNYSTIHNLKDVKIINFIHMIKCSDHFKPVTIEVHAKKVSYTPDRHQTMKGTHAIKMGQQRHYYVVVTLGIAPSGTLFRMLELIFAHI